MHVNCVITVIYPLKPSMKVLLLYYYNYKLNCILTIFILMTPGCCPSSPSIRPRSLRQVSPICWYLVFSLLCIFSAISTDVLNCWVLFLSWVPTTQTIKNTLFRGMLIKESSLHMQLYSLSSYLHPHVFQSWQECLQLYPDWCEVALRLVGMVVCQQGDLGTQLLPTMLHGSRGEGGYSVCIATERWDSPSFLVRL